MDLVEPVTVSTLSNPIEAELMKNLLESEGIRCFLNGLEQAENVGFAFNEIQVQVPAVDSDRARNLLQEHDKQRGKETGADEE